jgi:sugar lactone lactonase YvrE
MSGTLTASASSVEAGARITFDYSTLWAYTPEASGTTAFATDGPGPGQFTSPAGITVDQRGQLWVADTGNHRIACFGVPA